jgi:hypothetical protein
MVKPSAGRSPLSVTAAAITAKAVDRLVCREKTFAVSRLIL